MNPPLTAARVRLVLKKMVVTHTRFLAAQGQTLNDTHGDQGLRYLFQPVSRHAMRMLRRYEGLTAELHALRAKEKRLRALSQEHEVMAAARRVRRALAAAAALGDNMTGRRVS